MKKTYSAEEKKAYFAALRERWQDIKNRVTAGELDKIKAVIAEHGLTVSPWSYAFTAASMRAQGFDGIPYLDCKTFNGWKQRGFKVRKGEKSTIKGIVWLGVGSKAEDPDQADKARAQGKRGFLMPKQYALFHRSQVEPINAGEDIDAAEAAENLKNEGRREPAAAAAEALADQVKKKFPAIRAKATSSNGIGCLVLDFKK